jgi:flagellar assembly factor FliW
LILNPSAVETTVEVSNAGTIPFNKVTTGKDVEVPVSNPFLLVTTVTVDVSKGDKPEIETIPDEFTVAVAVSVELKALQV